MSSFLPQGLCTCSFPHLGHTSPQYTSGQLLSQFMSGWVKVTQSRPTLCDPMYCNPAGFSVHGILQAKILEWVGIPFSRGSFGLRDWTWVSSISGRLLTIWATREASHTLYVSLNFSLFRKPPWFLAVFLYHVYPSTSFIMYTIQPLLYVLVQYLPSPVDCKLLEGRDWVCLVHTFLSSTWKRTQYTSGSQ